MLRLRPDGRDLHCRETRIQNMNHRSLVIPLCLLAGLGQGACGGADDKPDVMGTRHADTAGSRLYLAGLGEIFVVDVESEGAVRLDYPALVGGDPANLIEARGNGFAVWSGSRTLFASFDLARSPRSIGRSRFFVAADGAERVWLIGDPGGELGSRGFVREVNVAGRPIDPPSSPPNGYPTAGLRSGLAFDHFGRLTIWDGGSDQIVDRLPTRGGLAGAAHGDMVSLCDYGGAELRIATVSSGPPRPIATPDEVADVDCRAGEISPDGTRLAAPVVLSSQQRGRGASQAAVALGIADLRTRQLNVVPGTRVPGDYRFARWSPDGEAAFILGRGLDGPRKGEVVSRIVEYSLRSKKARQIDVSLGAFYDVVSTEAAGPLPSRSYADSTGRPGQ